jgi:rhodanese-related sulfurtransferase
MRSGLRAVREHRRMTPDQVPTVRARDVADDLLLDVREQDEWDAGHAPEAVHVPLHELPVRWPTALAGRGGRRVAVVCRVGGRSAHATAYLLAQGVDAVNVDGGMYAWQAAGLPVVAGTSSSAQRPGRVL